MGVGRTAHVAAWAVRVRVVECAKLAGPRHRREAEELGVCEGVLSDFNGGASVASISTADAIARASVSARAASALPQRVCECVCAPPARQPATNNMLTPPTSQPQQTRIIYCCNPASPLPSPMPPNRTPATGGAASTCSAAHGTSSVTCHMSHVTCHMSHVTCHMSHVTCHMSHVTLTQKFSQSLVSSSSSARPAPWAKCIHQGRCSFTCTVALTCNSNVNARVLWT